MIPKYRAWDKINKEMYDWKRVKSEFTMEYFEDENLSFMQSTWLKDVNGNEIYEGDIVESTHYDLEDKPYRKRGIIGRDENDNRVILYSSMSYPNKPDWFYTPHSIRYAVNLEIIGNVYENAELLEVS